MNADTFFMRYNWSGFVDGGFIAPSWTVTPGGRPHLVSVALYSPAKLFLGTWERHNMPMDVIRFVEQTILDRRPTLDKPLPPPPLFG